MVVKIGDAGGRELGEWTGTSKYSENVKALSSMLAERNVSFLMQYAF